MEIMHRLQQSIGTCIGVGTGTGDWGAYYHLTRYGLVRFRDRIYISNYSELKNLILREFHAKPYLGHPGYHKTLATVKKLCYWLNLKKEVAKFMARCLDCE